jgi:hypothetical protein
MVVVDVVLSCPGFTVGKSRLVVVAVQGAPRVLIFHRMATLAVMLSLITGQLIHEFDVEDVDAGSLANIDRCLYLRRLSVPL